MKSAPCCLPVGLAEFDAGDLGDRVRFVGRFQQTGQQRLLLDRLRRELRVNARAAQEEQLAHPGSVGRLDDVILDFEVVEQEVDREIVVRLDAADLGRGDNHVHACRSPDLEKRPHRRAIEQIEFLSALRVTISHWSPPLAARVLAGHARSRCPPGRDVRPRKSFCVAEFIWDGRELKSEARAVESVQATSRRYGKRRPVVFAARPALAPPAIARTQTAFGCRAYQRRKFLPLISLFEERHIGVGHDLG